MATLGTEQNVASVTASGATVCVNMLVYRKIIETLPVTPLF